MVVNRQYYNRDTPPENAVQEGFAFSDEVLQETIRRIYEREFSVATDIELGTWREFWGGFNQATDEGFGRRSFNDSDYDFYQELRYNNGVFAAFRTHRLQNDIARQLLDEAGELKPFRQFFNDVNTLVAPTHLGSWLQTEYSTAVIRAHRAADWKQFERNKDILPNLEWMPSTSIHPGEDHQGFWGTIRPIDDLFWDKHHPGDRWNCKCGLEATDKPATEKNDIPEGISADQPSPGLDNNPGKDAHLFSNKHPYVQNAYVGAKQAVQEFIDEQLLSLDNKTFKEEIKQQRAEVREWAKENLIGKTVSVPGLGAPVSFTSTGVKEALNQPHKNVLEKNVAIQDITRLLRKGQYVRFDPDIKGNQMVKGYHYIQIEIGREPSFAVVRELNNGDLMFYSIVEKLKKKE